MAIPLIVGSQEFQYPEEGDQNWGEDATAWAEAITNVISTITGAGFIPETTADIDDNVSTPTDILGAIFDSSTVRAFQFVYAINRSDGVSEFNEFGRIEAIYNGADWDYNISTVDDSGVTLTVDSSGQVQYISSSLGGTYTGDIKFYANVTND